MSSGSNYLLNIIFQWFCLKSIYEKIKKKGGEIVNCEQFDLFLKFNVQKTKIIQITIKPKSYFLPNTIIFYKHHLIGLVILIIYNKIWNSITKSSQFIVLSVLSGYQDQYQH